MREYKVVLKGQGGGYTARTMLPSLLAPKNGSFTVTPRKEFMVVAANPTNALEKALVLAGWDWDDLREAYVNGKLVWGKPRRGVTRYDGAGC